MTKPCPGCGVDEGLMHTPDCPMLEQNAVKQTAENAIGKGKAGPGRPKGVANKTTKAVKEMVIEALDKAGGVDYLIAQSMSNPTAFLTLVGKVLPLQVAAELDHKISLTGIGPLKLECRRES